MSSLSETEKTGRTFWPIVKFFDIWCWIVPLSFPAFPKLKRMDASVGPLARFFFRFGAGLDPCRVQPFPMEKTGRKSWPTDQLFLQLGDGLSPCRVQPFPKWQRLDASFCPLASSFAI